MKAILVYEKGPAENLQVGQLPDPKPGPSDILVKVSYAGVNHGDVIRRERGMFPAGASAPYVLGLEGAGEVVDVGVDVKGVCVGQRVAFLVESGGYSQLVCVPSTQAAAIPDRISDAEAAASFCVGLTAWHLVRVASPQPGQTVLIHGGAGAVGSTLIQMCKERLARVLATVGSEEKASLARKLGADCIINHRKSDFSQRALDETNGSGVDIIFDCVGRAVVDGNFGCLTKGGQILYYGSTSGHPQFPGDKVLNGEVQIKGFVIFGMFTKPTLWQQGVVGLFDDLKSGRVHVPFKRLAMSDVVLAHKMLESREVIGKLILDMQ